MCRLMFELVTRFATPVVPISTLLKKIETNDRDGHTLEKNLVNAKRFSGSLFHHVVPHRLDLTLRKCCVRKLSNARTCFLTRI